MLHFVTVEQLKRRLRIDDEPEIILPDEGSSSGSEPSPEPMTDTEKTLEELAEEVESMALSYMERSYDSLVTEFGVNNIPKDIRQAIISKIASKWMMVEDETEKKRGMTLTHSKYGWESILIKYKPCNKI